MTFQRKVEVMNMLQEGKSCAAIVLYHDVNVGIIRFHKKKQGSNKVYSNTKFLWKWKRNDNEKYSHGQNITNLHIVDR